MAVLLKKITYPEYPLQENRYQVFAFAAENGKVQSAVLEGFEMDMVDIFT